MSQEQKKVECRFASVTQAKRTFVQIFPKDLLPPHYFEPVMHNGALKWVVLLGNEISIVPTNASELKRCLRFEIDKVRGLRVDEGDKLPFSDGDMTLHSGRVFVEYEEKYAMSRQERRLSTADSPATGKGFFAGRVWRSSASSSPGRIDTTSPTSVGTPIEGGETQIKLESFHKFERQSAVFFYSQQMWLCQLVGNLYGWKGGDKEHHDEGVVRDLFLDLQREIVGAKDLQEKVDLLDELALAARFDVKLKRLILLQAPTMLEWLCIELRNYDLSSWERQPSMQDDAVKRRLEALQYVTVLLETLHKTLFNAWPVFAEKLQGPSLMAPLLEPKGGLEVLSNALGAMYIKPDELNEKDNTAYLEVVHMSVAVMYNAMLLYEQASMFEEGHQEQLKKRSMLATILSKAQFMERRVGNLMAGLKHVIQSQPKGALRTVTLHQYATLLLYLSGGSKTANPISKALAANHTEDFHFIVPRFLHNEEHTHPLERMAAEALLKLLSFYCPDLACRVNVI